MAIKGYIVSEDVEFYLGLDFTAAQRVECNRAIEAAELVIDQATGAAYYPLGGTVVETHFAPFGAYLRLRVSPLTAITSIVYGSAGPAVDTAVAATEYRVVSAARGMITFPSIVPWAGSWLTVTYTVPAQAIDGRIQQACKIIAGHYLRPVLERIGAHGVDSYSVGSELTVNYQQAINEGGIPAEAERLLRSLGRKALFA